MGEHNCYNTNQEDCVKKKAYELWEKEGRQHGYDLHDWLKAEKAVKVHAKP